MVGQQVGGKDFPSEWSLISLKKLVNFEPFTQIGLSTVKNSNKLSPSTYVWHLHKRMQAQVSKTTLSFVLFVAFVQYAVMKNDSHIYCNIPSGMQR